MSTDICDRRSKACEASARGRREDGIPSPQHRLPSYHSSGRGFQLDEGSSLDATETWKKSPTASPRVTEDGEEKNRGKKKAWQKPWEKRMEGARSKEEKDAIVTPTQGLKKGIKRSESHDGATMKKVIKEKGVRLKEDDQVEKKKKVRKSGKQWESGGSLGRKSKQKIKEYIDHQQVQQTMRRKTMQVDPYASLLHCCVVGDLQVRDSIDD